MPWAFKSRISRIIIAVLLVIVGQGISGCASLSTSVSTPTGAASDANYFTIAVLPDTQYYSQKYPTIFTQQTQWIVNNAHAQHIVFVSQEGDLVNDYSC